MDADDNSPDWEATGGDADGPASDEWGAYPLIVLVIVVTVVLTVFELGPRLGGAFSPELVHH
ncbi:MAG: hypothetical protein IT307_18825 [Chloroflexi bacterium]|nr:hypothetical protein [Chloroflexota bacterium]